MQQNLANQSADGVTPEIEALLTLSESASIVDRLLSMPVMADDATPSIEWKRAVSARLESRLAQTLKTLLDADQSRNAA